MDNFSVQARAVIELGQQSENALSYLDRNTAAEQQARGTSWSRDQTRVGSICQIVVRDTGFNTGEILWRSVGLLVESVGGCKGGRPSFSVCVIQYTTAFVLTILRHVQRRKCARNPE